MIDAAVDSRIFERHPDYVAVVVAAAGLANGPTDADSDEELEAAVAELEAAVGARELQRVTLAATMGT